MDNIISPFQIPIYHSFIEKDSFNQIKNDTYSYINNNPNYFAPSWNCNTKTNFYEKNNPLDSATLKTQIKSNINHYYNTWNFENKLSLKLQDCWVNIAEQGSFQEQHTHINPHNTPNLFSGILYITAPKNSGVTKFFNPIIQNQYAPDNSTNPFSFDITPHEGLMVLFPSWLEHSVLIHTEPETRISISWNISYKFLN